MASTPITPVLDTQVNQTLKDIYNFLNKQSNQSRSDSNNLQSGIDNLTDRIDRDNKLSRSEVSSNNKAVIKALTGIANSQNKESVRSSQSDARDRATNQIFNNKINKNVDGFKNTLLRTLGDLKDFLKTQILACLEKSLRSFTDLAKTMRKANMTRAQKAQAQLMADSAIGDVSSKFDGLNVSKDEINGFMEELIASSKDLNAMSADQRANYIALRKRGLDDEAAFNKAMTSTSDQIKGTVLAMGDPAIAASLKKAQSNITNSMAGAVGGTGKAMDQMTENIRGIESELGNALSPESAAKLSTVMFKLQNGLIAEMTDEEKTLASITNGATDAKSVAEALKSADLTTLARLGKVSEDFANIANYQNSGTPLGKTVRSDAENREANSQNTTNGKLSQFGDKFTSGLDLATGGMFSKTANILDEYLGDSADINAVVKNGFKLVLSALKSISMNTSGMGKLLMGLGGAAAVIAIVANWDKIKPKLAPLLNAVKDIAKDIIANLPSFITDVITGVKSVFSDIFKGGLFGSGGGSSALSGAKSLVSDTASSLSESMSGVDISQSAKELGSSIGSLFSSIMDWIKQALPGLGKILHDIIGCINNAVNAVAPALSDICDVLHAAVDGIVALGISIVDCVRELGISIVDCVRELGVSLIEGTRDVLLSIAPAINSIAHAIEVLCEALAPVVPTIVETLKFATETILPPLVNNLIPKILDLFGKVVQNILPPLLEIIKKAVDIILPPMMEVITMIAETILPPLGEALSVIVGLVDRIVNLVLDILEPPLKAISEAISAIVGVVTSLANFVNDIVNVAHGLFNFFASKIPDLIGGIAGLFNWLKDGLGPVIKAGFSVISDLFKWVWSKIKEGITTFIAAPIVTALNALDVVIKGIQYILMEKFDFFGENDDTAAARDAFEQAKNALLGKEDNSPEAKRYEEAKKAFEAALDNKSITSDQLESLADTYKQASKDFQSEAGALITESQIESAIAGRNLDDSIDSFKKSITSDILLKGPQVDEAVKEEITQYLSGQKGNIAAESVLPPNTGDILNNLGSNVKESLNTLKSILSTINGITPTNAYKDGGIVSRLQTALVGEDGPEAILPLSKPGKVASILYKLRKKFSKNLSKDGQDDLDGTIAGNAIAYARDQLGKPYSVNPDGFVCNTLVQSAFKSAGLKKFPSGRVRDHWNRSDLVKVAISDAEAGMIGFSNKSDTTGFPQHMGIITSKDKWINASGSAVNGNYDRKSFRATPDSKGVIESKMVLGKKWGMVSAGYYPGMFDATKLKYTSTYEGDSPSGPQDESSSSDTKENPIDTAINKLQGAFDLKPFDSFADLLLNQMSSGKEVTVGDVEAARRSYQENLDSAINRINNAELENLKKLSSDAISSVTSTLSGEELYSLNEKLKSVANLSGSPDDDKRSLYYIVADAVRYLRDISSRLKTRSNTPIKPPRAPAS